MATNDDPPEDTAFGNIVPLSEEDVPGLDDFMRDLGQVINRHNEAGLNPQYIIGVMCSMAREFIESCPEPGGPEALTKLALMNLGIRH